MDGDMWSQNSSTNECNFSQLSPVKQAQEEFKYYFYYVLFKRKWLIIITSIIGIIGTTIGLYYCTPLYKASSKIVVRSNVSQELILFRDLYTQPASVTNTIPANNFIEIATSHNVARNIVKQFQLDEKLRRKREEPEDFREYTMYVLRGTKDFGEQCVKVPYKWIKYLFTGEYEPEAEKDYVSMAVNNFIEDMTEIDLVPESDTIILTIWDESPQEAEAIVKALTNQIIEQSVSMEQNAAGYGFNFTREELDKVKIQLAQAEDEVQAFKEKWHISDIETQKGIKLSELDTVEKKLITITAELASQESKLESGKRELNEQKQSLTSIQAYQDLQKSIILLKVDIDALRAEKAHYLTVGATVKEEIRDLERKGLELRRLEREAQLKEDLFNQLGKKHDELKVQSVSNLGGLDLRVIDTPKLGKNIEADYPMWDYGLGAGIPGSILLAILLAFFLELLNESFWIGDQVENKLGIRLLGSIRLYEPKEKAARGNWSAFLQKRFSRG
ncbi:MAG: Wzz/FepE/Etk N-terminal domain-containing protein [Thermodesulfobacteriota bacterium]